MTAFEVGEQVYVTNRGEVAEFRTITRVTKTQAIIQYDRSETRYNLSTGRRVGGSSWDRAYIEHQSESLDRRWLAVRTRRAAYRVVRAAEDVTRDRTGAVNALHEAYAHWSRLVAEVGDE